MPVFAGPTPPMRRHPPKLGGLVAPTGGRGRRRGAYPVMKTAKKRGQQKAVAKLATGRMPGAGGTF